MSGDPSSGVLRIEAIGLEALDERRDSGPLPNVGGSERDGLLDVFVCNQAALVSEFPPAAYFRYKAPFVQALGIVLLVPASPIMLILMALVCLTSAGPAIYRQRRIGKGGREFTMLKLRTMYHNAEDLTGPVWCGRNDSRITPVGRVLRYLHLDELPQLWNVARGEMDLVGPRPERPVFVRKFMRTIPGYGHRHLVRPGITGLAQVNLPPDETIECVHRKLYLDKEYVRTAGLNTDLRILGCTALRMCGLRHGRAVRLLGLLRTVPKDLAAMCEGNGHSSNGQAENGTHPLDCGQSEPHIAPAQQATARDAKLGGTARRTAKLRRNRPR